MTKPTVHTNVAAPVWCQCKVALPTLTTCAERVGNDGVRFECECGARDKVALPTQTPRGERVGNAC
jgi:hypothetical protein